MDRLYINSQFINNINSILNKNYFEVIAIKDKNPESSTVTYEIILNYENERIMKIKTDSKQLEVREESQLEGEIINKLMDVLEKMMLKDLMFGKVIYVEDVYGKPIKTLRTCIFEIENNNG